MNIYFDLEGPLYVSIIIKDVSAMTKEKTALVIPNAIQICTGNDKLFFCSFTVRDKAHMTLFKVSPFLK